MKKRRVGPRRPTWPLLIYWEDTAMRKFAVYHLNEAGNCCGKRVDKGRAVVICRSQLHRRVYRCVVRAEARPALHKALRAPFQAWGFAPMLPCMHAPSPCACTRVCSPPQAHGFLFPPQGQPQAGGPSDLLTRPQHCAAGRASRKSLLWEIG